MQQIVFWFTGHERRQTDSFRLHSASKVKARSSRGVDYSAPDSSLQSSPKTTFAQPKINTTCDWLYI